MSDTPNNVNTEARSFRQDDPLALIGLPTLKSIQYVRVSDILYCKGESSQTSVFLANHSRVMITRTLHQCEFILANFGFCRIHKSYVINLGHVKEYTKSETHTISLSDGTRLEVSKSYKDLLKARLNCI